MMTKKNIPAYVQLDIKAKLLYIIHPRVNSYLWDQLWMRLGFSIIDKMDHTLWKELFDEK